MQRMIVVNRFHVKFTRTRFALIPHTIFLNSTKINMQPSFGRSSILFITECSIWPKPKWIARKSKSITFYCANIGTSSQINHKKNKNKLMHTHDSTSAIQLMSLHHTILLCEVAHLHMCTMQSYNAPCMQLCTSTLDFNTSAYRSSAHPYVNYIAMQSTSAPILISIYLCSRTIQLPFKLYKHNKSSVR